MLSKRLYSSPLLTHLKMKLSGAREVKSFINSLACPEKTQAAVLDRILARNKNSSFGRQYNFRSITNERDFRDRVPINNYEDLRPYIEKQIEGGNGERIPKPLLCLQTSGTTGKPKYIPVYRETLRSYRRCQSISSHAQYESIQGIFSGSVLAIVSPRIEGLLENGMPYGSMSGAIAQSLSKAVLSRSVLPEAISEIANYEDRYRLIAALGLSDRSVSALASANPSTFLRLNDVIWKHIDSLLRYIETNDVDELGLKLPEKERSALLAAHKPNRQRADEIRELIRKHGRPTFSQLWPNLKCVATWTSGNCALLIPTLKKQLSSEVRITEMGYMASEFWGTITMNPGLNDGCLTIQDNFYEFIEPHSWDSGSRKTLLISDLEEGKQYYIIATTSDGLFRYFINDIIEVTGHYRSTPTIKFAQKGKGVTTLTGEKLYEGQVIHAMQEVCLESGVEIDHFVMLADRQEMSYVTYIECSDEIDLLTFSEDLNAQLGKVNIEFETKLKSGRIKNAIVRRVIKGTFESQKVMAIESGQREGQYKTVKLQYRDEVSFPFHECEYR
jgi:hypothetical protein